MKIVVLGGRRRRWVPRWNSRGPGCQRARAGVGEPGPQPAPITQRMFELHGIACLDLLLAGAGRRTLRIALRKRRTRPSRRRMLPQQRGSKPVVFQT